MSARTDTAPARGKIRHADSFMSAWGGSTQWKSAIPIELRMNSWDTGEAQHATAQAATSKAVVPAPLLLNKPLPELPNESPALGLENVSNSGVQSQDHPPLRQPDPPLVTRTSTIHKIKRNLTRIRTTSRRALNKPLPMPGFQQAPVPPLPPPPPPPRELPIAVPPPVKTTAVDRGTQTSPSLLPTRPSEPRPEPAPRKITRVRRPTFSRQVTERSDASEPSPQSAQKGFWIKVAPQDYFSLPFRADKSASRRSSKDSVASIAPTGARRNEKSEEKSVSDEFVDSIGTYESRYPSSNNRRSVEIRPGIPHVTASEPPPVTHQQSSASTPMESPFTRPQAHGRSATDDTIRRPLPMPMPFMRLPSFSGNRRRLLSRSDSSVRSNASPLRQSFLQPALESPPASQPPPSPGFYRQAVVTPDPQPEYMTFIPEHLKGSPLCPRSPKHASGGAGFCPMHGRSENAGASTASSTSSLEMEGIQKTLSGGADSSGGAEQDARLKNIDDALKTVKWGVPKHDATSSDCPANASAKGICIYHGRQKPLSSSSSEDSVTRVRFGNY